MSVNVKDEPVDKVLDKLLLDEDFHGFALKENHFDKSAK